MEKQKTKQEALLDNAIQIFSRGDHSLGYRTLLDAALHTDSIAIFKHTLNFVAEYEQTEEAEKEKLIASFTSYANYIRTKQVSDSTTLGEIIIQANQLEKAYKRNNFKLGPISLELKKGEVFGLVGENGNGKTTLLTILASLKTYTSGSISYALNTEKEDVYALKSKLVYIPQRTPTWYGSVIDNLKFALAHHGVHGEKNDTLVYMMIARFGLWKYKELKWKELSSGYKMRFELARTMLRKPEIILLDEPLANLDILAQQVILEDLRMLAKSHVNPIAMIFSSQQLYEVEKISDEVIYLRNGKPTSELGTDTTETNLIIELDTENSREEILTAFTNHLEKIEFNGGVYILYFKELEFNQVLGIIASKNLNIQYIRDISKSTRRLFVY